MSDKVFTIDEELMRSATIGIEQAHIYLDALRMIMNDQAFSPDAVRLRKMAIDAITAGDDIAVLSQDSFEL
ncbi:MAG TPA: hypothetical protein VM888_03605 [Chitinophagaceae bacterium]|jgi:hypothetical protein|nr:hypothetical protein [Chitinophagaceae bacterium]